RQDVEIIDLRTIDTGAIPPCHTHFAGAVAVESGKIRALIADNQHLAIKNEGAVIIGRGRHLVHRAALCGVVITRRLDQHLLVAKRPPPRQRLHRRRKRQVSAQAGQANARPKEWSHADETTKGLNTPSQESVYLAPGRSGLCQNWQT
ncbi:MAG: hypothetical protein VXA66_11430, partial [Alphaproteobacteria bacterium]